MARRRPSAYATSGAVVGVLGQAGGEQPLRDGVALLRVGRVGQSLGQLGAEPPEDVLEVDHPVAELAAWDAKDPPRAEQIEVELVAGLLAVVSR